MFTEALGLMNSEDDWKLNKEDSEVGAVLYSKRLKKGSKRVVFKAQVKIKGSTMKLLFVLMPMTSQSY